MHEIINPKTGERWIVSGRAPNRVLHYVADDAPPAGVPINFDIVVILAAMMQENRNG